MASRGSIWQSEGRQLEAPRAAEDDLVMSALGGCVCYLRRLKLDEELLAMRQMAEYNSAASVGRHMPGRAHPPPPRGFPGYHM